MEIVIKNNQRLIRINQQRLEKVIKKALKCLYKAESKRYEIKGVEISVLLVNDRRMQRLNRQYRNIDRPTDVLSFTSNSPFLISHFVLGDIVINLHQAKRQAKEYGVTFYEEVTRLLIHGLLHLLGYDHEKNKYQAKKMRQMELEVLRKII